MKPNISEFSYGYAVTSELVHDLPGISGAPVFPSLIDEGREGGGYDLMLRRGATPLFVQFKLSDQMVRRSAIEVRNGLLSCPFYRMHLRPARHSDQHRLLLELERSGQLVYYAAPAFHQPDELDSAFLSRTVVEKSVWIRPSTIGDLVDDLDHHISFLLSGPMCICSEPTLLEGHFSYDSMLKTLVSTVGGVSRSMRESERRIRDAIEVLTELGNVETALSSDKNSVAGNALKERHPLDRLAFLARRVVGAQVYLVHRVRR